MRAAPLGALLALACWGAGAAAQQPAGPALDVASIERGRARQANRHETGCVLCHVVPGFAAGGELGPSLAGIAQRGPADQLRQRIADARLLNPHTIMPVYGNAKGLQSVAPAYQGQPVLSAQGLDDIVAYLMALAR